MTADPQAPPVSRGDDPVREVNRIAGHFAQHLCDEWLYEQTGEVLSLAGERFTVEYPEIFVPLFGWDEDDDTLPTVLRRESDGAYFEVNIEVWAKRINPKEQADG